MVDPTSGTLSPAYGRDYKSSEQTKKAFFDGKDFKLNTPWGTTYCSVKDFKSGDRVAIRYSKLHRVTIVTIP